MSRPFSRKTRPDRNAATIETIYGMIVAQARLPDFYVISGVPDTVNGRFDMVVLHLWMVLRRLRRLGENELVQLLFDHFCSDMDGNLREMGVGDLSVPKRMTKFGEAFYGRTAAYDRAIAAGHDEICAALSRNILPDGQPAGLLASYVERAIAAVDGIERNALVHGQWRFPAAVGPVSTEMES
jgi:cytochrome b pre-mRNA-processing protein 3